MRRIYSLAAKNQGRGSLGFRWQKKKGNYLATSTSDNTLHLYDKQGDRVETINLPGTCIDFSWDCDGSFLAVITAVSATVTIWDAASKKTTRIDTGFREGLSILVWSKTSPVLAVGSVKGNLLIYDHGMSKKLPIVGKHFKRIVAGMWSKSNLLALIAEDKTLTISNKEGDTLVQIPLKNDAALLRFFYLKPESTLIRQSGYNENCVGVVVGNKSLFLIPTDGQPTQLNFPDKNGNVIDYFSYKEGFLCMIFSSGHVALVSLSPATFGQEATDFMASRKPITSVSFCESTKKLAVCSENNIRIYHISGENDGDVDDVVRLEDENLLEKIEWSDDGKMLAVSSASGSLHVYLAQMSVIGASFGQKVAYLTSLTEVTISDIVDDEAEELNVRIELEPSVIAVGPFHVVAAMNNKAWFYSLTGSHKSFLIRSIEYVAMVKDIKVNGDFAAALFTDGRINIHVIESSDDDRIEGDRESRIIEEKGKVTSIVMTSDFLIFSSGNGTIESFFLEDWTTVNVYRHSCAVFTMDADVTGVQIAFIDELGKVFVYNSVSDVATEVSPENFPTTPNKIFWDQSVDDDDVPSGVFIVADESNLYVHNFVPETIEGSVINFVGNVNKISGQTPLLLFNGIQTCQTTNGKITTCLLPTHDFLSKFNDRHRLVKECLPNSLKLARFGDAIQICERLEEPENWKIVANTTINHLKVNLAIKLFAKINDLGMSMSLKTIDGIEEWSLLAGHLALFLEKYDLAQDLFLSSSRPQEALKMRQVLQDWEQALALANRLAPKQVPTICREYASQLEFSSDFHEALLHFEKAIIPRNGVRRGSVFETENADFGDDELGVDDQTRRHNELCMCGIARNSIRCGNTRKGLEMALKMKSNQELQLECAQILESMKLYTDAALLYENGGDFEKAASFYLKVKNVTKLSEIIDKVSSKTTLLEYAKYQEHERNFREAVKAYKKGGDNIQVIRVLLDDLKNPGEAVKLVKELDSIEGSKMVAKFFQKMGDMNSAIEFLVLSNCTEEAFQVASSTGQMDTFATVLINYHQSRKSKSTEDEEVLLNDFKSIALHYEQESNFLLAGKFNCLSRNYKKGVKLLFASIKSHPANEAEAIQLAIDAASKSRDEAVIRSVIDYLIGDVDGVPKDFKYLFRLYMKLGHYKEAAKTAIIIAREEQFSGNYRNSHSLLFEMSQELKKQAIKIPAEMNSGLMLIHSYLLAKVWIKIGDHVKAAQLLIRVSKNISRFPSHTVPILTSTVIECSRASFKRHAFEFATILMKPENREQIDPKLKKKIETLVRKSAGIRRSDGETDMDEHTSPCPFCESPLGDTELTCTSCKNRIPFCIASGYHVVLKDLTFCPNCLFPAIHSHFERLLTGSEPVCPMCLCEVNASDLKSANKEQLLSMTSAAESK